LISSTASTLTQTRRTSWRSALVPASNRLAWRDSSGDAPPSSNHSHRWFPVPGHDPELGPRHGLNNAALHSFDYGGIEHAFTFPRISPKLLEWQNVINCFS
jgi:hypothetical protein